MRLVGAARSERHGEDGSRGGGRGLFGPALGRSGRGPWLALGEVSKGRWSSEEPGERSTISNANGCCTRSGQRAGRHTVAPRLKPPRTRATRSDLWLKLET